MRLSLAALFLLFAPTAFARVGDNESELVARYGAVINRQPARKAVQGKMHIYGERLTFHFEFWTASAVVIGGRCEEINYTREGRWTDPHFRRLLEINGGFAAWTEQKTRNPDNHRNWLRRDQTSANWGLTGFMVRTPAVEKALANLGR
jgi:hypothetical protein